MIEDEELRNLYKLSSEEHLQQLESGLQYLLAHPDDKGILEDLRRETHSLKGDSRSVGVEPVETLVYCIEDILGSIKRQQIVLTPQLSDRLHQGLDTISKLVAEAVTGEPSGVDIAIAATSLMEGVLEATEPQTNFIPENDNPVVTAPTFIGDEELREIYKIATQERLQTLEKGLEYLLIHPENLTILDELRRDAHSIKGDSRSAGVKTVETVARCLEEIILDIRDRRIIFTPELCARIDQGLKGIRQLATEAVTGESCGVDPDEIVSQLLVSVTQSSEEYGEDIESGKSVQGNLVKSEKNYNSLVAQSSIIDDEELRNIYSISSRERLQTLEEGLRHLQNYPNDRTILDQMRRDAHSMKGDSRSVGVESVETIAHCLEEILLDLQNQRMVSTPQLCDRLYQGFDAIDKLVNEAVTGEPSGVDPNEIINQLLEETTKSGSFSVNDELLLSKNSQIVNNPKNSNIPVATKNIIEDEELREVYKLASQDRVEKIEAGLQHLKAHPDDIATVEIVRRQIHILKGDSASVGIESVETVAHYLEQILLNIQEKQQYFNPELSDRIVIGLDAINKLVKEAVTGEFSGININDILYQLTGKVVEIPAQNQKTAPTFIEDRELGEVYRITSQERLQRMETDLLYLEQHPQEQRILEQLLREAHSLKGDSRSVGIEAIETIVHEVEEIFSRLKREEMMLTPQLGDLLYQSLDLVGKLVKEAVTGEPSRVDPEFILNQLIGAVSEFSVDKSRSIPVKTEVIFPSLTSDLPDIEEAYRVDTIRVPTRDLDALVTQTDELTVTRISIGYTTAAIEEMAILWEDWKTFQRKAKYSQKLAQSPIVNPYEQRLEKLIESLRISAEENTSRLNEITAELNEKIRALRLLPLGTLFQLFPRMVRDLAKQQGKEVQLIVEGGETTADKRIIEEIKDSLMHMIRNAIDHGIETIEERERLGKPPVATIWLRGYQRGNSIIIEVADDGRGLNIENIKQTAIKRKLYTPEEVEVMKQSQIYNLIFAPGFSTRTFITEISGRGIGLDVVRSNIERLKGNIQIESTFGEGCSFRIELSTSLASVTVLVFEVQGIVHAIPLEYVKTTLFVALDEIAIVDGKETILWEDKPIAVTSLADLLELSNYPAKLDPKFSTNPLLSGIKKDEIGGGLLKQTWYKEQPTNLRYCILLQVGDTVSGFFVDRLLDTQEVVLKPQSQVLKKVRNVTGATILPTGDVCSILSAPDLIRSREKKSISTVSIKSKEIVKRKPVILLVEDSIFVRTQEKRLLEKAGYEVVIAVDGLEGYNKLKTRDFDAVVSDVEMPHLDGFSLTATIRQNPDYHDLPIILVTTLDSDADQKRGSDAGANAYIIKSKFNQEFLLETLAKLV